MRPPWREGGARGRKRRGLVLLWNAVEPARLAGDEDVLREIAELTRSVPGREGESPRRRGRHRSVGLRAGERRIATG